MAHLRLLRWAFFLSGYNSTVHYSKRIQVANCLLRSPTNEPTGDNEMAQCYNLNINGHLVLIQDFGKEVHWDKVLVQVYQ